MEKPVNIFLLHAILKFIFFIIIVRLKRTYIMVFLLMEYSENVRFLLGLIKIEVLL